VGQAVGAVEEKAADPSAVGLRMGAWMDGGQQLAALTALQEKLEKRVNPWPLLQG